MTMTMIQCLGLSLRGHGPHASYEPTGQCLFKTNGLKDKLWRLSCRCATQLLAADAVYMTTHTAADARPQKGTKKESKESHGASNQPLRTIGTSKGRQTSERKKKSSKNHGYPSGYSQEQDKRHQLGTLSAKPPPNWIAINASVFDERVCKTRSSKTPGFMNIWFLTKSTNSAPFRAIGPKRNQQRTPHRVKKAEAINTYLQIPPPRRSKSLGLVRFLSNLLHGRRLTM